MIVKSFVFNAFYENTYVVYDKDDKTMIIDPGCYDPFERNQLIQYVINKNLEPICILNTHCHIDHVLGNAEISSYFKIPLIIPENEVEMLQSIESYAPSWGITRYKQKSADRTLSTTESTFEIAGLSFELLHVPGHSPGHIALYSKKEKLVLGGDVLFKGSIGRTDLPGGDHNMLIKSITDKFLSLPDETHVLSGHGPSTTIGEERRTNPFLQGIP